MVCLAGLALILSVLACSSFLMGTVINILLEICVAVILFIKIVAIYFLTLSIFTHRQPITIGIVSYFCLAQISYATCFYFQFVSLGDAMSMMNIFSWNAASGDPALSVLCYWNLNRIRMFPC